ncbi:cytochrome p450 3a17 [Apiospora arundinis]|uniref:Cytochrome p450 3a17 n=1 Tax=Apiospora arundinis TaxID=335852 RepID=A0ABR2JGC1_9PEZI
MTALHPLTTQGTHMNTALLVGAVAISLAIYAIGTIIYRLWLHPLAKVPGPKYMAVSDVPGQWISYINLDMVRQATVLHRKYGPIVRIGPDRLAIEGSISWPEVYGIRSTSDQDEFSKIPDFAIPNDHLALLGANRENHRRQRRQMNHAFSSAALHEQEAVIMQYIDKFMDKITERAKRGEALNIVDWLNFTTFDIIGDLAFADSFHSLDGDTTFVKNIFRGSIGTSYRRFLWQFPLLKLPLMMVIGAKELAVATAAGKENFKMGRLKGQARMAMGAEPKDGRRDFATYMLRKGKDGESVLSDEEVQTLSSVLVIAGSETTATALSGFSFLITTNLEKQQILAEEIRSAFTDETDITLTGTGHLEYLNAVIEETLRLYPPAAALPPRVSPGAELHGLWVPRGTKIHVYQNATNRNPDHFKDPDSFEPERWLNPNHPRYNPRFASDKKQLVKPFSNGPRDCIGKNLAYTEMRVIISRLLYRFDIELLPGQERWMSKQKSSFIWVKGPLEVKLKPRAGITLD